ncbi:MFS transporter [Microbacterium sp. STN6]|uniref:MFS transporter n=1 Tax=Microbacterium sp. STN6 TaxID=2995588 RepID=UPI00226086ED|nr:MFS transporter [Microbacterium sp. STN6]MCX7522005.1 MFS transporter [Microbacterium sp. STN6]
MSSEEQPFSIRAVALAAFVPTLIFSIGEGAIIPIIPIVASNLGAGLALAGFIGGMIMVGELLGDIPSGWVVARVGERNAMIWASFLCIIGLGICVASPTTWALTIGVFLIGIATAVFALARHAFMTGYVPLKYRARALSTLGGVFRGGWFVGPFISAGVISLFGDTHAVFWVHIAACVLAAVVLIIVPDPSATVARQRASVAGQRTQPADVGRLEAKQRTDGLFRTIVAHREVLSRMGVGAALIGGLRSSRTVILPLYAVAIGLSDANTAFIIGIAGAVDFALFYVSGQIMDRYGRMWSAIPSMIGLGLAHIALAFVTTEPFFIAVAVAMSVANGIGSGILMTLGADLAPPGSPAPFLGAWRFTGDAGQAAAPLAVSGVTAVLSLGFASVGMGVLGLIGAGLLVRWIPRYIPSRR